MSDIILGLGTQQNLLALQGLNTQLDTTQNALATGLSVSSATDNAVKFFESQSLNQRANDLSMRKDSIDQGISAVTAASQGITSAISVLEQMQGIVSSAQTQTASQRQSAGQQFDTLGQQMSTLLGDASYQGLNLVNSTVSNLTLQFSQQSASTMKIAGQNLLFSKLVSSLASHGAPGVKGSAAASHMITGGFSTVGNSTSKFTAVYNLLQTAITKAQAAAQTLGTNVAFLETRLSFTEQYATTLQGGASALTVADVNQESTDLVTLQTRQSLAIQSLSIATQSEQAVLHLFNG